MKIGTKEFHDAMENFENNYPHERHDKEPEELWTKGLIYQDGELNRIFCAFHLGYEFAKVVYR